MIRLTRTSAVAFSILAAAHVFPIPAEAQLGGLARRARSAVEGKAEDKIEEAMPFTPPPAPEFSDRLLEITDARLAGMLKAFEAEIKYADKAGKEYKDRAKEDEASAANEARINVPLEEMNSEEFEEYMLDLAERGERISQETLDGRSDPEFMKRRDEYLAESQAMLVEQSRRAQLIMAGQAAEARRAATEDPRLLEACGEAPVRPLEPQSELAGPEGVLAEVGAETAELNADQYAIMRERVLYWSKAKGRPSGMGFSDGEMSALTAKKGDLEHVVERMRKAKIPV